MKICSKCGNVFEGKFCNECGTPYSDEPKFEEAIISGAPQGADSAPDHALNQNDTAVPISDSVGDNGVSQKPKMSQDEIATLIAQLQQQYPQTKSQSATQVPGATVKIQQKFENFNTAHNNILAKVLRFLPAALNLIFGAFIMIFMACSAFNISLGSILISGYDLIGSIEDLIGNVEYSGLVGASVGAIFLVISGIAYLGIGSLKMIWSVKKPYYKNKALSIFSIALLFETFIMSCVMVGSINSLLVISSGASGALILTCSLIGGLIVISELVLNLTGCLDFMKPLYADALRVHMLQTQQKTSATYNSTVPPTQNYNMQSANSTLNGTSIPASEMQFKPAASANYYSENEITSNLSIACRNGAKGFRWIPAITSIITAAVMALLSTMPIGHYNPLIVATPFTLSVSIIGLISSVLFFLLGVYRLFKAYSDPYEKRPIVTMVQVALLWATSTCSTLNLLYWTKLTSMDNAIHIASLILTILCSLYLLCYIIGAIYQILVTKTYKRAAVIRSERGKLCRKPEKVTVKNKIVLIVMAVILIISASIAPIVSISLVSIRPKISNAYDNITIDNTEYEVIEALGEPYTRTENNLIYFSNNYAKLLDKIKKCKNPKDLLKYQAELATIKYDMLSITLGKYNYRVEKATYLKQIFVNQDKYLDKVETASMGENNDKDYYDVTTQSGHKEKALYDGKLRIVKFSNGELKALADTSFGDAVVTIGTEYLSNTMNFTLEYIDKATTITFQRSRNNYSEYLVDLTYANQHIEYDSAFMSSARAIIEYLNNMNKTVRLTYYEQNMELYKELALAVNIIELRDTNSNLVLNIDKTEKDKIKVTPSGNIYYPIQNSFITTFEELLGNYSSTNIVLTNYINNIDKIMKFIDEFDIDNDNYYGNGNALYDNSSTPRGLIKYITNYSDKVINLSNLPYRCTIKSNCFNTSSEVKINLNSDTVQKIDSYAFGEAGSSRNVFLYTNSASLANNFNQSNLYGVKTVAIAEGLEASAYLSQNFSLTGTTYYNGTTYNVYTY